MAKNNQVVTNLRINADMNLRNIDNLKKELSKVVTDSGFDKKLVGTIEKCINNFERLEKDFTSLSKKTIFNEKDMRLYAKSVEDLGNVYKNVKDVMGSISNIDIAKSTKAYANYIEDLNKQVIALKQNFKETTGLNFDKEIGNLNQMKASVETLIDKKNELAKSGVSNEFNRLLKEQNNELDKHKIKLSELKKLRQEVNNTREAKAKEQYASYEELQSIASTKITKGQITTEFEQKEVDRLTKEYNGLEKQLQKVSKLKTEVARNRNIANIAKQLGVDANTIEDLQKAIDKARELIDVTARKNVRNDNAIQKQIVEQYNALNAARNMAKEYLAQIEALSDAMVKQSSLTNARTVSGLDNDITREEIESSLEIDTDALQRQAEANTNVEIEGIESQLSHLNNLVTQLVSAQKQIHKIEEEGQNVDKELVRVFEDDKRINEVLSNDFKRNSILQEAVENTTKNIDQDTSKIESNTRRTETVETTMEASKLADDILRQFKTSIDEKTYSNIVKITDDEYKQMSQIIGKDFNQKTGGEKIHTLDRIFQMIEKNKFYHDRLKMEVDYRTKWVNAEINGDEEAKKTLGLYLSEIEKEVNKLSKDIDVRLGGAFSNLLFQLKDKDKIFSNKIDSLLTNDFDLPDIETLNNNIAVGEEIKKQTAERALILSRLNGLLDSNTKITKVQSEEIEKASIAQDMWNGSIGQLGIEIGSYFSLGYILNHVFNLLRNGINIIEQMDESIVQIGIVTNQTAQEVWGDIDKYIKQAKDLHMTTTDLLSATKLYYQQGLNTAEVNSMVEATARAAALGETTMAEAANTLTSIMNSYQISATKMLDITDKISAVGSDSAADFGEMSQAIEKVASSAATAGLDIDHLMGYLGKMIEVTREAPTNIGTAMKTIVSRMAELKADPAKVLEDGTDLNRVETALKSVGIRLLDTTGNIRPLSDVINELGVAWEGLSRNHQAYLATIIAGNRQQSRFLALMNNYDRTLELVASAQDSAGRSAQQFRNYLTGTHAALDELKVQGEEFLTSLTHGNGAIRTVYKSLSGLLSLANQMGPVITGLTLAFGGLGKSILSSFSKNAKEIAGNKIDEITDGLLERAKNYNRNDLLNLNTLFGDEKDKKQSGFFKNKQKGEQRIFNALGGQKELDEFNKISKEYTNTLKEIEELELEREKAIQQGISFQKQDALETLNNTKQKQANAVAIQTQNIKQKMLNATMVKTIALQAAVSLGITLAIAGVGVLISYLSDMNKAERERLQTLEDTAAQAQEEYSALETLANKYINLKEQVSLTEEESEELKNLNDELINQYPELIAGIDEQGNAYAKATDEVRKFLKEKKKEVYEDKIEANNAKLNSASTILSGNQAGNNEVILTDIWGAKRNSEEAMGDRSKAAIEKAQKSYDNATKTLRGVTDLFSNGTSEAEAELEWRLGEQAKGRETQADFNQAYLKEEENFIKKLKENYNIEIDSFEDYISRKEEIEKQFLESVGGNRDSVPGATAYNNYKSLLNTAEGAVAAKKASGDIQNVKMATMQDLSSIAYTNFTGYASKEIIDDINYDDYGTDVENQTSAILQKIIDGTLADFGDNTTGGTQWVKDNQQSLSSSISQMLLDANKDDATNKKINAAFKNYNDLKKSGASKDDVNNAMQAWLDEIKNGLVGEGGTLSEEQQKNIEMIAENFKKEDTFVIQTAKQILANIGKDENDQSQVDELVKKINTINSAQRNTLTAGINNILKNTKDKSKEEQQAAANSFMDAVFFTLEEGGSDFRAAYDALDRENAQAIEDFVENNRVLLEQAARKHGLDFKIFKDALFEDPGVNTATERTNLQEAYTKREKIGDINISDTLNQGVTTEQIMDPNSKVDISQTQMIGDKLTISTGAIADNIASESKKIQQTYKNLAKAAEDNIKTQEEQIEADKDTIKTYEERQKQGEQLTDSELADLKVKKDSVKQGQKNVANLKKEAHTYLELADAEKEVSDERAALLRNNASVVGQYDNVSATIDGLKDLAATYDLVKNKQMSQLDIIQKIANDREYLKYLEVQNGQLVLSTEVMEYEASQRIAAAETAINVEIAKLEAQQAYLEGSGPLYEEEFDNIGTVVEQYLTAGNATGEYAEVTSANLQKALGATQEYSRGTVEAVNEGIRAFNELEKSQLDGSGQEVTSNLSGSVRGEDGVEMTTERKEFLKKNVADQIEKLKAVRDSLKSYQKDPGSLFKDINNMGGGGSSGGDSFEPVIEKLEKFYNYLRQLEELEAELNRIREKRNLIDATKNYYIGDLQKENELLKEQQSIYNDYIRDQGPYLQELRNQIQSMFGDWAYFNDEGVIQVKQTEFTANSEEEEERLSNFLELVDLYQNEYNTREENINKLYEIENTQLENIATMYEKILTRVQDITDALNRQKDLLDHDMTMSFSNIAKFNMMDDQMSTAAQGIKETYSYLNQFAEEMEDLNKEIGSGPFSELLMWDETLQNWRVNEDKLQDDSIVAKYEKMGYVWQDIDTYVRSVATESQSLREAWKETEDSANNFAQLLKQLVDDRISLIQDYYGAATEELNKIFNSFDSKMADADNQNNLFGVASESLEDKYLTLVTATVLLKQTIQQLKDNRGGILERIQKDYPEYIDLINGVAVVNKQRVEESQKLTEEQRSELLQLYGILEASEEQIGEMEDKLVEYFETMLEMEEAKRDAIIDLKQQVHDELIARDQEEIDDLRAKYDKMSQLDSEYYSELTQRVNDSRELRQNRQQASDIAQMQARLAILKADNSGTYNSELIELQKQLNTQLQTQADNEVNRELERIQREQQEREEDRQLTISAMENVLTFKDENSWYWQEAQRIWDEGPESVTGFLRSSREYMNISDEQRAVEFENLNNNMNTAFSTLQTEAGLSDRISDGVVIGKSDEEQIKLDMINTNIKYVNDALGENSNKIVWANSQNMLKLEEFNTNVAEGIIDITTKMQSLYTQGIEPGVKGVKDTIIEYLGLNSNIWNKIGDTNSAIGFVKSSMTTGFEDTVNAASLAATRIIEGIREAKEEYLKSDTRLYNWLNDRWAEKNAPKTPSNGNGNTTPPTVSGSGNSSSSTGGNGSGSTTAESRPELKIGATVSVKPGTKWYYDSYGTSPTGIARGGVIRYTNLKGSHPYNIEGLGWIRRQDIVGYSKGGYVDYTGIANVHGTQHEPEAFLNAKQTRLFEVLRDSLTRVNSSSNIDKNNEEITKEEYNISNVNIEVKEIADTDSIDKVVQKVKTQIYNDSIGRNNMAIRRR